MMLEANAGECTEEEEEDNGEGKLVAIDKGFKFELDEFLRASAYMLGKIGMGIVYKVILGNGVHVAVRRVGEGGRSGQKYKEFANEVQAIARVRHRNFVRLRAYYWAPYEKLLISDFISNGNYASALKGGIATNRAINSTVAPDRQQTDSCQCTNRYSTNTVAEQYNTYPAAKFFKCLINVRCD